ncbi:MAG TPA: hypothetical protein VG942_11950 [Hyphomonadaceae bacterium]|nr:hypothetical protein [Hyphomonadaceae bacterium]
MTRAVSVLAAMLLASACASTSVVSAPRPPQGAGPAGTQFGFWDRDAEGAVDVTFRSYIVATYDVGDEARAKTALETDGFSCETGKPGADGKPVARLKCDRLYQLDDDIHSWTVEFWDGDKEPRAHYYRIHRRDPLQNYNDKKAKG